MHDDEADPEYEYVPVDLRPPPGWAEAFCRRCQAGLWPPCDNRC